ncbi:hypothetical protein PF002_g20304 [Phytophthora fragariae]|uniref:Crinkler effector protein N-terminal domain-containing protein n=1 Tax=Phytophthora fragariae TaxID=53985 RepID=A0A6A3XNB3_9STRA|nr:hypothetical protein PF007_g27346 [Phytophthora fragariae]KAE9205507.1 hypothetical protein PF002_g20304 [Phytophthora fragariae]
MKLFCSIIGADGAAFPVGMRETDDTVGDLKDTIRAKKINDLVNIDADKMRLFLARKDDEWMTTSDTPDDSWLQNELDATKLIEDAFKFDLGKRVVHVLARLPAEVEAEAALAQRKRDWDELVV